VELNQERQDKEKHSVTHALRARQTSATDTPKQDMDPEIQNMGRKKLKSAGPGSESGKWQQADVSDKRRQENITKVKQAHKRCESSGWTQRSPLPSPHNGTVYWHDLLQRLKIALLSSMSWVFHEEQHWDTRTNC